MNQEPPAVSPHHSGASGPSIPDYNPRDDGCSDTPRDFTPPRPTSYHPAPSGRLADGRCVTETPHPLAATDPTTLETWRFPVTEPDPTSLDPAEISCGFREPGLAAGPSPADEAAETSFRHSFWSTRRGQTRDALTAAGASTGSMLRFNHCGSHSWVYAATGQPGRFRVHTDKCHSRWCEACQVEHRRVVSRNLSSRLVDELHLRDPRSATDKLRFITLTLRTSEKPLADELDRLYACFRTLRQRKIWRACVNGGILFLELTRNRAGHWHPHLHVLCGGKYIPQDQLREAWKQITGDSWIVDVRLVRNPSIAAGYVAKYASKVVPADLVHDRPALIEAIKALAGRHTFTPFGCWRGWKLSEPPPDDCSWEPVAPLWIVLRAAAEGKADAQSILMSIRKEPTHANDPPGREVPPSPTLPDLWEPADPIDDVL